MADLSYTIDVNTSPAQRNIDNLNKKIAGVTTAFDKLKTALAGIALGSAIAGANKFADAVSDISDATGIAIEQIIGLSSAFIQNGGDAEKAQTAVLKFAQTIGDAVDGSDSAQKAFQQVGVSLKDIQTLSEQELLKKTIDGLGKMENASMRIATQTALFGKNARGINFQGVAGGMGGAVAGASQMTEAIKSGAAAQQSLEVNLQNLTQALLKVIKPLNDIVASVNISVTAFESLVKSITYAVTAYLIFTKGIGLVTTGVNSAIKSVKTAGGVFATLGAVFTKITVEIGGFFRMWGRVISGASGAASVFGALAGTVGLLGRAFLRFFGVVGIIMSIAEAVNFLSKQFFNFDIIDWVIDKFVKLKNVAMDFFNIKPSTSNQTEAETKRLENQAKAYEENKAKLEEFTQRRAKLQQEISKTSDALKFENDQQLQNLALETRLVGKSEEQQEILRATADLYMKEQTAIKGLLDKRAEWAKGTEEQKASLDIIDTEINKIKELTQVQATNVTEYIGRLQTAKILEQDRVNNLQLINDAMQRQKDIAGVTSGIYSDLSKKLNEIAFGKGQRGKSVFEQQRADIERNIQLLEADMAGAIMAAFETEDGYTNIQQMNTELEKMYNLTAQLKQEQLSELDISNQWATGWQNAFNSYMENATNAAKIAGEQFNAVTNGMNSAIDKFVESGKFSFKDMANSIIKDLLRIELKKQAAMAISGAGSFFGSLLGFANGGSPPVNKPSIVGENGPELFVPRTAGTVVPNGQFGGGSGGQTVNNNYVYNVSAIDARSVASFFAENRKTMLGTIQMAQKELPYGNR